MSILLDTHAFAWLAVDDRRLSRSALARIEQDEDVFLSAVTAYEVTGKVRTGKWPEAVPLASRFFETMAHYRMRKLPVTLEHAHLAGTLSAPHRDPFDRMLAAQAIVEKMPLVTADPAFRLFDVRVLW